MRLSFKTTFILLILIIAAGTFLRLHLLEERTFWIDEAASWQFARLSCVNFWKVMWQFEGNGVFYYLLLHLWLYLGDSEWMIRSLSVLFGVATIPTVYVLGTHLFSRNVGLISAALIAVHAFHIRYSQEARTYSLLVFLLVLSTYFFCCGATSPCKKNYWMAYILASVLAIYSHIFAIFVLLTQWMSLDFAQLRRISLSTILEMIGALALLLAPMVAFILLQSKGQIDWIKPPTFESFFNFSRLLTGNKGDTLLIAYIVFCILAWLPLPKPDSMTVVTDDKKWHLKLVTLWLIFPIAMMLGASLIKPIFTPRYVLMCVPALVLLAGYGITKLSQIFPRSNLLLPVVLTLLVSLSTSGFHEFYRQPRSSENTHRSVVQYVLARQQPRDGVFFHIAAAHSSFAYYTHQESQRNGYKFSPDIIFPSFGELPTGYNPKPTEDEVKSVVMNRKRVWLIDNTAFTNNPVWQRELLIIQSTLREQFQIQEQQQFPKDGKPTMLVELYVQVQNKQEKQK